MIKWFRRKQDNKALAGNAEQEISTIKKLDMARRSLDKLETIKKWMCVERRLQMISVDLDRRRTSNG